MSAWRMTLDELVKGAGGRALSSRVGEFAGVGTDTRADLKGKIFVALKGDNFDAHDFLPQAVQAGATALLVHRLPEDARKMLEKASVVEVGDTLKALQDLGRFWRRKSRAKIVGITGTNGKTTTKEFAAALLGSKLKTQYSKGSFNNHWGVPISLLSIEPDHEAAIVEMGMNHPGELTVLSRIAEPDVVMVTMVGRGHLEGLGSVEGVAKAKAEIYEHAPENALRVFNMENEHTRAMFEKFGKGLPRDRVLTFGGAALLGKYPLDIALDVVTASADSMSIRGEIKGVKGQASVQVFGRHNVVNLMAAASTALACGLAPQEIWAALPQCRTAWGRNQWVKLESGARALFDAYNANPESMRAAVENFAGLEGAGRKIAILGEMREMGDAAESVHRELGQLVARAGFAHVLFIGASRGAFEAGIKAGGFSNSLITSDSYKQNLAPQSLPVLQGNDIVLIKGSRGVQLEKALSDLKPLDFQAKK